MQRFRILLNAPSTENRELIYRVHILLKKKHFEQETNKIAFFKITIYGRGAKKYITKYSDKTPTRIDTCQK